MSVAVGIGEVGINKVLCMKNGYTLLFHFEIGKPITLAVFDTLHKRVVNAQINCEHLNLTMLSTALFKGMYEINGEAVLFFEQQNSGRHSLIRLRFDPVKGRLIEEEVIGKSHGLAKHMKFLVMRYKGEDGYEVLFCEDIMQFKESNIEVKYFNAKHVVYKTVPLVLDRKKYDYLNVVGAESMPQGVCVSLALSNMLVNGTGSNIATMPVYNHYLHIFYIPKDSVKPKQHIADLSTSYMPYYTTCTYNPFAEKVNLMLFSFTDALYQSGIDTLPTALVSNLLLKLDEYSFSANYNWITNEHANAMITANKLAKKKEIDSEATYKGFPVKMVTNSTGLSTVISESYERFKNVESYIRPRVYETFLGDISITQFDDEGKELWGIALPKTQYFKSYRNYYYGADMAKRWQQQAMFNDRPPQIFDIIRAVIFTSSSMMALRIWTIVSESRATRFSHQHYPMPATIK
jgi:hypothetical protein